MRARRFCCACLVAAFSAMAPARGAEPIAGDLREQVVKLPIELTDADRVTKTESMLLTIFRPQGSGPFPIAILNHGRLAEQRKGDRWRYEDQARYFVRKGFVVVVPTRVGYGPLATAFDPENGASCRQPLYAQLLKTAGGEILEALKYARTLPDVDRDRAILVGVSVGGISSVAAAATNPPGVVASINFSGGAGGDAENHPGIPCAPDQLTQAFRLLGQSAKLPSLWLYADNDRYFGREYVQGWVQSYRIRQAPIDLVMFHAFGDDGHKLFGWGMDVWMPAVEKFLAQLGFTEPGMAPRPRTSGFATVKDTGSIPLIGDACREVYAKFLATPLPRAFAVSHDGSCGYASGAAAPDRALEFCRVNARKACALYAIDNDVVWQGSAQSVRQASAQSSRQASAQSIRRSPGAPAAATQSSTDRAALREQIRQGFEQQRSDR